MTYFTNTKIVSAPAFVAPTKVYLFVSCPCESKAAHVRNAALKAMAEEKVDLVAYRYVQSKALRKSNYVSGMAWLFFPVVGCLFTIPSMRNVRRFHKTERLCLAWLRDRSEGLAATIQEVNYFIPWQLRHTLHTHGVDTKALARHLDALEHRHTAPTQGYLLEPPIIP